MTRRPRCYDPDVEECVSGGCDNCSLNHRRGRG